MSNSYENDHEVIRTCDGCAVLRPVVEVEGSSYLCAECEPELGSIGPEKDA